MVCQYYVVLKILQILGHKYVLHQSFRKSFKYLFIKIVKKLYCTR